MKALCAVLERSPAPSRTLDAQLIVAFDIRPRWLADADGELWIDEKSVHPVIRWCDSRMTKGPGNPPAYNSFSEYPCYTASLDAAVELVERVLPGTEWAISTLYGNNHAEVNMNAEEPVTAQGATPAIAVCLALCKAFAQGEHGLSRAMGTEE